MTTVREAYNHYSIMPSLALHQKRVAAVALHVMSTLQMKNDSVVSACLLHDMGNIIKFDLDRFPAFTEPEGVNYWKGIQESMFQRYGKDEHRATMDIAKELAVSQATLSCIAAVGFSLFLQTQHAPLTHQICAYADMRVGPYGVLTVKDRLEDGRRRYEDRRDRPTLRDSMEEIYEAIFSVERHLEHLGGRETTQITDAMIDDIVLNLDDVILC